MRDDFVTGVSDIDMVADFDGEIGYSHVFAARRALEDILLMEVELFSVKAVDTCRHESTKNEIYDAKEIIYSAVRTE